MILRQSRTWSQLVFMVRAGTIIEEIWLRFLVGVSISVAVTWVWYANLGLGVIDLTTTPFTLIGFALSIFLGFRNNASYDRFWEGRKLWGALVNTSRTLTRQVQTCLEPDLAAAEESPEAWQRRVVYRLMGYVHSLRLHLRGGGHLDELKPFLPESELKSLPNEQNQPIALIAHMGADLQVARRRGWLDSYHHVLLEGQLTALTNIQGACERIKSTPIPLSHTALTHRLVGVYVWALPFGIVKTTGLITPLVVAFVGFAFFALDALGEQLEDPFGTDCNDLPLLHLSTMIETNLRQRLGEVELPAPIQPDKRSTLL